MHDVKDIDIKSMNEKIIRFIKKEHLYVMDFGYTTAQSIDGMFFDVEINIRMKE